MNMIRKSLTALGAVFLLALLLAALAPKAAHGVAAALVQVANTAAAPAITEDLSKLPSQSVHLYCSPVCSQVFPNGNLTPSAFTVPATQSLVISTVELQASGGGDVILSQTNFSSGAGGNVTTESVTWVLYTAGPFQFEYPSGMVFAPGTTDLSIIFPGGGFANLYGYLSAN